MKTQTLKIMLIGLLALSTAFGAIGCSSDRRNNNATVGNGFGYGAFGFGVGGSAFRALGNEPSGQLQLGLEFGIVGQSAQYSQVQAAGELLITQGIACNGGFGSGLAGGVWSVRTQQPILMSQDGALQTLVLDAQGPNGWARITVENATVFASTPKRISCSGVPGFDELAALVRIESINGQVCQATFAVYTLNSANICGGF